MGSGGDRSYFSFTTEPHQSAVKTENAEHGEDGKWALCMHMCVRTPHTHLKLSDQTHKH